MYCLYLIWNINSEINDSIELNKIGRLTEYRNMYVTFSSYEEQYN